MPRRDEDDYRPRRRYDDDRPAPDFPPARRPDRRRDDYDEPKRGVSGAQAAVLVCGGIALIGVVVALFVAGFAFVVRQGGGGPSPAPVVTVDLAELLKENDNNPVATQEKYRGRTVEVTGYVVRVSSNIHHQTYVTVSASPQFRDPELMVYLLPSGLVRKMKDFPNGSKVKFQISLDQSPDKHLRARGVDVLAP
jgi:hypothetical protein